VPGFPVALAPAATSLTVSRDVELSGLAGLGVAEAVTVGAASLLSLLDAGGVRDADCPRPGGENKQSTAAANTRRFMVWRVSLGRRKIETTIYIVKDAMGNAGVNLLP
jgi:hypothetical protein